jgi:hypothetical protein
MNYKGLILLVGVATIGAVFYIYKKSKNDLPIFDEATNTINQKGNTYSADGKLIKCVNAPCYDDLTLNK